MKHIKSQVTTRITDFHLENCLCVATTSAEINFDALSSPKQSDVSLLNIFKLSNKYVRFSVMYYFLQKNKYTYFLFFFHNRPGKCLTTISSTGKRRCGCNYTGLLVCFYKKIRFISEIWPVEKIVVTPDLDQQLK